MVITQRWLIGSDDPAVREHVIRDRAVVPFAFWLSRSLDALAAPSAPLPEISEMLVRRPVALDPGGSVEVEFCASRDGGPGRFEIRLEGDVVVEAGFGDCTDGQTALPRAPAGNAWDRGRFYSAAAAAGLRYGPSYQRVAGMSAGGAAWSAELTAPVAGPACRITSWDALLQCPAVVAADGGDACWIPFRIERVRFREAGAGESIGRAGGEWIGRGGEERVANLFGFLPGCDAAGVEFLGVHYRLWKGAPSQAQSPAAGVEEILDRLQATPPAERRQVVFGFISDQILEVLQWDDSRRSELDEGFAAVGLDSLMAVDLQFRLQAAFRFALPIGENLELNSVDELADFMMRKYEEMV